MKGSLWSLRVFLSVCLLGSGALDAGAQTSTPSYEEDSSMSSGTGTTDSSVFPGDSGTTSSDPFFDGEDEFGEGTTSGGTRDEMMAPSPSPTPGGENF